MDSVEQPAKINVTEKNPGVVQRSGNKKSGAQKEKFSGEDRLIMLCDGIFAIATTLLVINIKIAPNLSETDFNNALLDLLGNEVVFYLITFAVIASLWVQHRQMMRHIKYQDSRFTWLTMLFLVFVAFFPVTSGILGLQGNTYSGAILLYTLTFAGCGLSLVILWLYASWHHQLIEPELTREQIVSLAISFALTPVYFSLSLLLLFLPVKPTTVFWSWFLLPVVTLLLHFIRRKGLATSLSELVTPHSEDSHST